MAKFDIDHKCGHSVEVQIVGPIADRDRKAAWMATNLCPACARAAKAAEQAATSAAAAEANQAAGLVALEGSEKQIAWAETIRATALEMIAKTDVKIEAAIAAKGGVLTEAEQRTFAARKAAVNYLQTCTSAKWWIDNRDAAIAERTLLAAATKELI